MRVYVTPSLPLWNCAVGKCLLWRRRLLHLTSIFLLTFPFGSKGMANQGGRNKFHNRSWKKTAGGFEAVKKNSHDEVNDYLSQAIKAHSIEQLRTEHCNKVRLRCSYSNKCLYNWHTHWEPFLLVAIGNWTVNVYEYIRSLGIFKCWFLLLSIRRSGKR